MIYSSLLEIIIVTKTINDITRKTGTEYFIKSNNTTLFFGCKREHRAISSNNIFTFMPKIEPAGSITDIYMKVLIAIFEFIVILVVTNRYP